MTLRTRSPQETQEESNLFYHENLKQLSRELKTKVEIEKCRLLAD
jgi:hypothetical protein